jgi:RHS repeat-associated protein
VISAQLLEFPSEPTETMTFSISGLSGYTIKYWDGSTWVTVSGGTVSSNNKVWKKISFAALATTKIRVSAMVAIDSGYDRMTEVEAWGDNAPPPSPVNVAATANGGTATVSSILNSGFPASGVINGDRKGTNWGSGGGWADSNSGTFPDWVELDFSGSKTINEIDVFTLQDSLSSPSEPTVTMTFSTYGLSGFTLFYWDGSAWQPISGGSVTSNNKVWKKLTFSNITTTKIKVQCDAAIDNGYSRLTEIEAWGTAATGGGGSTSSDIEWLVTDQLGTPRMVFDKTGSLASTKRHDYLPFGEELIANQGLRTGTLGYVSDNVRQQFTQKERDNETGLDYFGARYYTSIQGRFVSPDRPFADQFQANPQSWNSYSYVRNSPCNKM